MCVFSVKINKSEGTFVLGAESQFNSSGSSNKDYI